MGHHPPIAYFSMEIGLETWLPTYSGGLGILAGDTLRAAADLGLPMVAITLLHRKGYFHQRVDDMGRQADSPVAWNPPDELEATPGKASVPLDGQEVHLRAWRHTLVGAGGHRLDVYFLDADLDTNDEAHRRLTDHLYGGDHWYRLRQEIILGIGGVRMLRSLGIPDCHRYHMNEGHSSLLTAELLREHALATGVAIDSDAAAAWVRARCAFTTHTPLAAGHDRFALEMVRTVSGEQAVFARSPFFVRDGLMDTTHAALTLSGYSNAVSLRHGEVTRRMFPGHAIDSITNGVHAGRWVSPHLAPLLDAACPGWRADSRRLSAAANIPDAELLAAHARAKRDLVRRINRDVNAGFSRGALTLAVARRATPYKRLDLVLSDLARLGAIAHEHGPIQIVFAGKSHPRDGGGRELIERLHGTMRELPPGVRVAFVPGYDIELASLLVAGADVWVNCPQRPLEASGTSGMKAALNAVPSLSVLDGWWLEGCRPGETGWAIGEDYTPAGHEAEWAHDAQSLYHTLAQTIAPLYARAGAGWASVMRGALSLNGPRFNTHRTVAEYAARAYGIRV